MNVNLRHFAISLPGLATLLVLAACGAAPAPTPTLAAAPPTAAPLTASPTAVPSPAPIATPARPAATTLPPVGATQTVAALLATVASPGASQTAAALARATPATLIDCPSLLTDAEVGSALGATPTRETNPAIAAGVASARPELRAACAWTVRGARKGAILTVSTIPAGAALNAAQDPALAASGGVTGTTFTTVAGLGDNARWVTIAARPDTGLLIFYRGNLGMSLSVTGANLEQAKALALLVLSRLPEN